MVCPKGEAVTDPPGQERQQRRAPIGCSGKIAAANPSRRPADTTRSNIECVRAGDLPSAHPLLRRDSRVPDEADIGRGHQEWKLPVMDWIDSSGHGKILPRIHGNMERPWSKNKHEPLIYKNGH